VIGPSIIGSGGVGSAGRVDVGVGVWVAVGVLVGSSVGEGDAVRVAVGVLGAAVSVAAAVAVEVAIGVAAAFESSSPPQPVSSREVAETMAKPASRRPKGRMLETRADVMTRPAPVSAAIRSKRNLVRGRAPFAVALIRTPSP
jgi:hypothetical protein